jgi:creatinine amidohydrolase
MQHEWSLMSWLEVRDAAKEKPVVLVPLGCVETQGPHTPVGMEYIMASHLARDVAERTGALALPALPYGNSDNFRDIPGTVYVRSEILTELYYDILASVIRAGFERILCIAYHIPNEPPLERAARKLRDETGIAVAWVNPGALAATYLKDLFDDPVAARGHGAEPGISLMRHLVETEVPDDARAGEQRQTLGGFDVRGAGIAFRGFPVGMPISWSELYPETGGFGNPTLGSPEIGKTMYDGIVDHLCALVEAFARTDVRNPAAEAPNAG